MAQGAARWVRPVHYRGRVGEGLIWFALDLRRASVTSAAPARDGRARRWQGGVAIRQRARAGLSQSASRVQCVWRGTGAERSPRHNTASAAGGDDREIGSRAGTTTLDDHMMKHLIVEAR